MPSSENTATPSRFGAWISAGLLVAGSLAFLGAGRLHPHIGPALGPVGSEEFFRGFAHEILHTPHWGTMHAMILLGPVLWALGVAAVPRLFSGWAQPLGDIGRSALLLAAGAWAVAFILDGFVAPVFAQAIADATDANQARITIASFKTSQLTMARLGMVSVSLFGAATLCFSTALLITARRLSWLSIVGALGIVVGAWPLLASARGAFAPGPFTSQYWTLTAVTLGLWFLLLASTLPRTAHTTTEPSVA